MKSSPLSPIGPLLAVLPRDPHGQRPTGQAVPPAVLPAPDPLLEVAGRAAAAGDGAVDTARLGSQAAMQVDPVQLRRMAWQPPDPAVLAQAWSDAARQHGRAQEDIVRSLTAAVLHGAAISRDPASTPVVAQPDPHFLPVYFWGGAPLLLGLAVAEGTHSPSRRRRQRAASLRLEIAPPLLGPLMLEVYWAIGGLELTIALKEPENMPQLREALPAISSALRRAGLTLLRLQLTQGPAAFAKLKNGGPGSFPGHAPWQALLQSPGEMSGLFRGLAETAVTLMGYIPREGSR